MPVFPTTRWSLIQASDPVPGDSAGAWGELVRAYRPAIVGFFRRSALARDADDLAQEFLLRSMRDGWWTRADREIGSFRRFLLVLLKRFLSQELDAGHRRFETTGHETLEREHGNTPDRQFDLDFALCLTSLALDELGEEYRSTGRGEVFAALVPLLLDSPEHGELALLGERLGIAPNTLAVQLKRLRTRLQKAVRSAHAELSIDAAHAAADMAALRLVLEGST
jgi:hypothetical protein